MPLFPRLYPCPLLGMYLFQYVCISFFFVFLFSPLSCFIPLCMCFLIYILFIFVYLFSFSQFFACYFLVCMFIFFLVSSSVHYFNFFVVSLFPYLYPISFSLSNPCFALLFNCLCCVFVLSPYSLTYSLFTLLYRYYVVLSFPNLNPSSYLFFVSSPVSAFSLFIYPLFLSSPLHPPSSFWHPYFLNCILVIFLGSVFPFSCPPFLFLFPPLLFSSVSNVAPISQIFLPIRAHSLYPHLYPFPASFEHLSFLVCVVFRSSSSFSYLWICYLSFVLLSFCSPWLVPLNVPCVVPAYVTKYLLISPSFSCCYIPTSILLQCITVTLSSSSILICVCQMFSTALSFPFLLFCSPSISFKVRNILCFIWMTKHTHKDTFSVFVSQEFQPFSLVCSTLPGQFKNN